MFDTFNTPPGILDALDAIPTWDSENEEESSVNERIQRLTSARGAIPSTVQVKRILFNARNRGGVMVVEVSYDPGRGDYKEETICLELTPPQQEGDSEWSLTEI
jgi:hypothetical protein